MSAIVCRLLHRLNRRRGQLLQNGAGSDRSYAAQPHAAGNLYAVQPDTAGVPVGADHVRDCLQAFAPVKSQAWPAPTERRSARAGRFSKIAGMARSYGGCNIASSGSHIGLCWNPKNHHIQQRHHHQR